MPFPCIIIFIILLLCVCVNILHLHLYVMVDPKWYIFFGSTIYKVRPAILSIRVVWRCFKQNSLILLTSKFEPNTLSNGRMRFQARDSSFPKSLKRTISWVIPSGDSYFLLLEWRVISAFMPSLSSFSTPLTTLYFSVIRKNGLWSKYYQVGPTSINI